MHSNQYTTKSTNNKTKTDGISSSSNFSTLSQTKATINETHHDSDKHLQALLNHYHALYSSSASTNKTSTLSRNKVKQNRKSEVPSPITDCDVQLKVNKKNSKKSSKKHSELSESYNNLMYGTNCNTKQDDYYDGI